MHKYNIVFTELYKNINTLYKKIDMYVNNNFDAECYYVGTTVRELCGARDNCYPQFFERSDILQMIDMLCANSLRSLYCNIVLLC